MLNFGEKQHGTYYRPHAWAKHLVRAGHDVTIICLAQNSRFKQSVTNEDGIRIFETPNFMDGRRIMDRISGTTGWGLLDIVHRGREIKRGNYDLIHCFEHFPNVFIPLRKAASADGPVVVSDWCDLFGAGGFRDNYGYRFSRFYALIGRPLRKYLDFMEEELRRNATAVTVISDYLHGRAADAGVDAPKIHLIRGSVDTGRVKPMEKLQARRQTGLNAESKILGFLGTHQSDIDFSLEAFAHVLQTHPEASFVIVGRTDPEVESAVHRMGLSDRVIRTGWCTEDEMIAWMSAADAFLMPLRDNLVNVARWPNKIGEYMALGRPVVSTRVGDVARLIETNRIGNVSDAEPTDFGNQLLRLLSDNVMLNDMGDRARKLAEDHYDISIQGSHIEHLYESLLEERRQASARRVFSNGHRRINAFGLN